MVAYVGHQGRKTGDGVGVMSTGGGGRTWRRTLQRYVQAVVMAALLSRCHRNLTPGGAPSAATGSGTALSPAAAGSPRPGRSSLQS